MDRNICRPKKTVKTIMEDKVSKQVDGENSRRIIDRIIPVCNPHDNLFCHFDIPNTKIPIARVAGLKKPKAKLFSLEIKDWSSLMDWSSVKVSRQVENGREELSESKT